MCNFDECSTCVFKYECHKYNAYKRAANEAYNKYVHEQETDDYWAAKERRHEHEALNREGRDVGWW